MASQPSRNLTATLSWTGSVEGWSSRSLSTPAQYAIRRRRAGVGRPGRTGGRSPGGRRWRRGGRRAGGGPPCRRTRGPGGGWRFRPSPPSRRVGPGAVRTAAAWSRWAVSTATRSAVTGCGCRPARSLTVRPPRSSSRFTTADRADRLRVGARGEAGGSSSRPHPVAAASSSTRSGAPPSPGVPNDSRRSAGRAGPTLST